MSEDKKILKFSVESAILRELGEQLVSRPEVALTELIKNSYDADSAICDVTWDHRRIVVKDAGHGMTLDDFRNRWMRIATGNKGERLVTDKLQRKLTGSKGIGRFAVRFLGHKLTLITIAKDILTGKKSKLIAYFDWNKLDGANDLEKLEVRYKLYPEVDEQLGTTLVISNLRYQPEREVLKRVKSESLKMVTPIDALLNQAPKHILSRERKSTRNTSIPYSLYDYETVTHDQGFSLKFYSPILTDENNDSEDVLSERMLELAVARATFYTKKHEGKDGNLRTSLHVDVAHQLDESSFCHEFSIENHIGEEIYGSVCFFPQRAGVFANKPINGNLARQWVKDNSSVSVFDKGFRVIPYGQYGDDWLHLDEDTSRSSRRWRTKWMEELFPITADEMINPSENPMLALPETHQLVGAVFVDASNSRNNEYENSLSPTMDRQGFLGNEGFQQLEDITRFSVELIAKLDRSLRLQKEKEERDRKYEDAWDDIDKTIKVIEKSPSLSQVDKKRITDEYQRLREDYVRLSEHDKVSRENLVTMGLLGVVAGFMTHEYQSTLHELDLAQKRLDFLSQSHPELKVHADKIAKSIESFNGYIDYTQAFISSTHSTQYTAYKAAAQIRNVVNTFGKFRAERNIKVDISSIGQETMGPDIPLSMYKGIIHNLYSNALKALASYDGNDKTIWIFAENRGNRHIVRIEDNGPGIPAGVRSLIWDPLFTTTSNENNPLGSGMGLGLSLVKRLVELKKGKIHLLEPSEGFSTCFEVELPAKRNIE
ncbi:TPA: ATP-binding protein [Vibrio parahaemolyticus]